MNSATAQHLQIFLGSGMIPHVDVHRRSDDDRRGGGEIKRAEKIVADAAAEFGDDVGSGRRNQQQIRALRDSDVFDGTFELASPPDSANSSGDYFFPGERGKGKRRDEFAARASHDYFDGETFLLQAAHQLGRFVGRHSAGYAKSDAHGRKVSPLAALTCGA